MLADSVIERGCREDVSRRASGYGLDRRSIPSAAMHLGGTSCSPC